MSIVCTLSRQFQISLSGTHLYLKCLCLPIFQSELWGIQGSGEIENRWMASEVSGRHTPPSLLTTLHRKPQGDISIKFPCFWGKMLFVAWMMKLFFYRAHNVSLNLPFPFPHKGAYKCVNVWVCSLLSSSLCW